MGIDNHGLMLLLYAKSKSPLGHVATMGRQSVHLQKEQIQQITQSDQYYGPYCEDLLIKNLKALSVTSFDASDYEHADIVHDMNLPIDHVIEYDTIVDFGTLEHIFNIPVALGNISNLCKEGGIIIHALPANNYNGHGFWQFSPELFFSLYSTANGFADTEVFIAELDDNLHWWKAPVPRNGIRVEFTSSSRSYVLVLTRKKGSVTRQSVQQSDYQVSWDLGAPPVAAPFPWRAAPIHAALKRIPYFWRLADRIVPAPNSHRDSWMHRLSSKNRHYTKIPLTTLLRE